DEDWRAVESWVDRGGRLVLAGLPEKRPDWIGGQTTTVPGPAGHVAATKEFRSEPLDLPLPPAPPLRMGSDFKALLVRGKAGPVYAAERAYGEGTVLALAD